MIKLILSGIYVFLLTIFAIETLHIEPNSLMAFMIALLAGRFVINQL
ncbi:MAG: hypothetical protein E6401_16740 [Clostridiales bacterium]|nr:hypothetical protein [Clostridiales bacterium]